MAKKDKKKFTKQAIKDYAQNLYLTYDADGRKKYSLRDISQKIHEVFEKAVSYRTVKNWADENEWDKLATQTKALSIQKADDNFTREEVVKERRSDEIAFYYKSLENLFKIGYSELLKRHKAGKFNAVNTKDLMKICAYAFDRLSNFLEIEKAQQQQDVLIKVDLIRD